MFTFCRGQYYQENYILFATRSNMANYNNVLSTVIHKTADKHLPRWKKIQIKQNKIKSKRTKEFGGSLKSANKSSTERNTPTKLYRVFIVNALRMPSLWHSLSVSRGVWLFPQILSASTACGKRPRVLVLSGWCLVLPPLLCSGAHGSAVRPADGHWLVSGELTQGLGKLSYPLGLRWRLSEVG